MPKLWRVSLPNRTVDLRADYFKYSHDKAFVEFFVEPEGKLAEHTTSFRYDLVESVQMIEE